MSYTHPTPPSLILCVLYSVIVMLWWYVEKWCKQPTRCAERAKKYFPFRCNRRYTIKLYEKKTSSRTCHTTCILDFPLYFRRPKNRLALKFAIVIRLKALDSSVVHIPVTENYRKMKMNILKFKAKTLLKKNKVPRS